jgi:putative NADH-flavin reductase
MNSQREISDKMSSTKLLLVGATGKTGQFIGSYLEDRKVPFKRFVRLSEQMTNDSFLGDIRSQQDVIDAMADASGVICALNTEGNGTLISGITNLITAMKHHQVKRIVTIGTAGILQSELQPELLRYQSSENKRVHHDAAKEHEQVYLALANTDLDWTIICPTRLVQEELRGVYRVRKDLLPSQGASISFADTAELAVSEYFNGAYVRERVGISY